MPFESALLDSPQEVCLEVEHVGVGIADEQTGHIFDPFYTRRSGGTGLGLARVERVVNEHGGTIEVNSSPGLGTQFAVRIPRTYSTQA